MHLLYVDDDRINLMLFEIACAALPGLQLATASSGAEALELVRDRAPQLLVIDLHLPDMLGYALLPQLRQQLAAPALPAYLCTADAADQVAGPARAAGFDGCWPKPVPATTLRSELARRSAAA